MTDSVRGEPSGLYRKVSMNIGNILMIIVIMLFVSFALFVFLVDIPQKTNECQLRYGQSFKYAPVKGWASLCINEVTGEVKAL